MKLIVHPGTGTILNAAECVVLNVDSLDEKTRAHAWSLILSEEDFDLELTGIAEQHGIPADWFEN